MSQSEVQSTPDQTSKQVSKESGKNSKEDSKNVKNDTTSKGNLDSNSKDSPQSLGKSQVSYPSKLFFVVPLLVALVAFGIYYYLEFMQLDERLLGKGIVERPSFDSLNELEKRRWDSNVSSSFPNSKPVKIVRYKMNMELDKLFDFNEPLLLEGMPV